MNSNLSRNILLYGAAADLPQPIPLRAGPLSLYFEAGDLRYVRLGEHEILRRVYVAVRDRNWATILMRISDLKIDAADDSFTITYSADHTQGEIDFHWQASIQGATEGRISFSMQGEARSTFLKNRIGFCVLHPPQCAGRRCRIVQEFGNIVEKPFPRLIAPAPHQDPFQEVREMSYEVADGLWADLKFEGDIFETEDQRNWSDGSYKTFCTPLRLPFPAEIKAGTQISQRVDLSVRTEPISPVTEEQAAVRVTVGTEKYALPQIGLCLTPSGHNARQIERLKRLALSHVRTDLHMHRPHSRDDYLQAVGRQAALGVPLELAVYCSNEYAHDLRQLADWISSSHVIARCILFQAGQKTTPPEIPPAARRILAPRTPHTAFGGGSDAYFTELNRERRDIGSTDFVCYSVNPQVHAFDNTSLVENARAIGYTIESAQALSGGRPIAITPITLRPRFNPDATAAGNNAARDEVPDSVDPRQMSLFGAAWTLASLQTIIESRAASATYYETVGWHGVMERDDGSPAPDRFQSIAGGVFPMYHVFEAIGEFKDGEAIECHCSHPLRLAAVALRHGDQQRIVVANLTPRTQPFLLAGLAGNYRERGLDEKSASAAMENPEQFRASAGHSTRINAIGTTLSIAPYGLLLLDRD